LVSNSKLLKRNSKSFSIFQVTQIGFGRNSLEAWSIFPPSPAQLRLAHAAIWPNLPTHPFSFLCIEAEHRHRSAAATMPRLLCFPFSKSVNRPSVSPS
jgi:hypothetical protein